MELSFDTADGRVVHAYVPTVPYRGIDLYRALAHELNVDLDDFSILHLNGLMDNNPQTVADDRTLLPPLTLEQYYLISRRRGQSKDKFLKVQNAIDRVGKPWDGSVTPMDIAAAAASYKIPVRFALVFFNDPTNSIMPVEITEPVSASLATEELYGIIQRALGASRSRLAIERITTFAGKSLLAGEVIKNTGYTYLVFVGDGNKRVGGAGAARGGRRIRSKFSRRRSKSSRRRSKSSRRQSRSSRRRSRSSRRR